MKLEMSWIGIFELLLEISKNNKPLALIKPLQSNQKRKKKAQAQLLRPPDAMANDNQTISSPLSARSPLTAKQNELTVVVGSNCNWQLHNKAYN